MLNNAAPTSTSNKKTFLQRIKGKKRKFAVLFLVILISGVLAFLTTKKQIKFTNPFKQNSGNDITIVNKDTGELTDEFYKNIDTITIDQVREASNSTGVNPLESPYISDSESSKKIYEDIGNSDPQNHEMAYSDYGISIPHIEIKQGDMITWVNNSTSQMNVIGDGWRSQVPRDPGDNFSYGFLFLGEYKYKINDTYEGTVIVVQ